MFEHKAQRRDTFVEVMRWEEPHGVKNHAAERRMDRRQLIEARAIEAGMVLSGSGSLAAPSRVKMRPQRVLATRVATGPPGRLEVSCTTTAVPSES